VPKIIDYSWNNKNEHLLFNIAWIIY
jgi:hypothetical protein